MIRIVSLNKSAFVATMECSPLASQNVDRWETSADLEASLFTLFLTQVTKKRMHLPSMSLLLRLQMYLYFRVHFT